MRKLLVIVLCSFGAVFIGLLLTGAMTIRRGFSARNEPSAIEVIRRAIHSPYGCAARCCRGEEPSAGKR